MKHLNDYIAMDAPDVQARGSWVFETSTTEGIAGVFTVHADTGRLIRLRDGDVEYFDATFQPTDGAGSAWQTKIRGSDLQRLRDAAKRTAERDAQRARHDTAWHITRAEMTQRARRIVNNARAAQSLEAAMDAVEDALEAEGMAQRSWQPYAEYADGAGAMQTYLRYLGSDQDMRPLLTMKAARAYLRAQGWSAERPEPQPAAKGQP